jgi:hypothetical protein
VKVTGGGRCEILPGNNAARKSPFPEHETCADGATAHEDAAFAGATINQDQRGGVAKGYPAGRIRLGYIVQMRSPLAGIVRWIGVAQMGMGLSSDFSRQCRIIDPVSAIGV